MTLRLILSRQWLLTTFLVILGAAICVRLGFWQLDRLKQRRAFNAHVLTMRSLPPLDLNNALDTSALTNMEYRAAIARGKYDYEYQIALRNQYHQGQYGYHLLTPLLLDDRTAILVDRGWIPAEGNESPVDWRKYDEPQENVMVHGILRLGNPQQIQKNSSNRLDFWMLVDLEQIGKQIPYALLPVYLQLDPQEGQTTPPIPYQPTLDLSEGPHLGYAIQWFTFAAILLFGYPVYLRKQEEQKKRDSFLILEKPNGHE